jgi:uncharacterized membrane protein
MPSARYSRLRPILRLLATVFFVGAGLNHFLEADFYQRIIPPGFPAPGLLVVISGICEIAGGVGLLIQPLRRAAAWGLIALLVAVFPANVYMAFYPEQVGWHHPHWMLWARLPMQVVIAAWVWMVR